MARKWGAGGALPSWSSTITNVDSVSEYISEHLYDKLIWLSKPYAGQIMTLGALILNMVVIVSITMSTKTVKLLYILILISFLKFL